MPKQIQISLVLLLTLVVSFTLVPWASAHRPEDGIDDGLTIIPSPAVSYAYYQEFDGSSNFHAYTFDAQAGQFFHAGINIPQIEGLEDYGVTLALLGPGLPAMEAGISSQPHSHSSQEAGDSHAHEAAFEVPNWLNLDGLGGIVVENQPGEDFFEPFTQTNYWGRQVLELTLPETGRYYLLVWNPEKEPGKYVLDTGREEVFGPADVLRFPIWWLNTRLYFEQGPALFGAFSAVFFGIAGLVVYRRRKINYESIEK